METITTVSERQRPRPRIAGASKDDVARIAYGAVEGLEFLEMNDGNRLGYHLYLYLMGEIPSVADAIYESKSRSTLGHDELARVLNERLVAAGASKE